MRTLKSAAIAGVLACMVEAAKAEELLGTIAHIDLIKNPIAAGNHRRARLLPRSTSWRGAPR